MFKCFLLACRELSGLISLRESFHRLDIYRKAAIRWL